MNGEVMFMNFVQYFILRDQEYVERAEYFVCEIDELEPAYFITG